MSCDACDAVAKAVDPVGNYCVECCFKLALVEHAVVWTVSACGVLLGAAGQYCAGFDTCQAVYGLGKIIP